MNTSLLDQAESALEAEILNETQSMIDRIGTVTIESEDKLIQARMSYDALTREQQLNIKNLDVLLKAEKLYSTLLNQSIIAVVEKMKAVSITELSVVDDFLLLYEKLTPYERQLQLSDIDDPQAFVSDFKVNAIDKQIANLTYALGEPSEEELTHMLELLSNVKTLEQSEKDSLLNKD